jgi:hypothetical protein
MLMKVHEALGSPASLSRVSAAATTTVGHAWYQLSWVEWVGIVGFVLTIVGLWLTWEQASQARQASEAAAAAVETTQRQLRGNQLLIQIAQLRWLATAIDDAVQGKNPELIRTHLGSWRWAGGQINGILRTDPNVRPEVLEKLQLSIALAFAATDAVVANRPTQRSFGKAREAIGQACDVLNTWAGEQSYLVNHENGSSSG